MRRVTLQQPALWKIRERALLSNEEADREAKSAALEAELLNIPLPPSDFTAVLKQTFHQSCDSYFKDIGKNKGAYYTQFFYKFRTKPWFSVFFTRREWIVSLFRMRSNHYSLNSSLARKNIIDSGVCPCDSTTEQDLDHVLWDCPLFTEERRGLIRALSKALKQDPPFKFTNF